MTPKSNEATTTAAWIEERNRLKAAVQRVEKERDAYCAMTDEARTERDEAEAELAETREALKDYGNAEQLARSFHELYEALAPEFGYETRKESAVHWDDLPQNNKTLMVAVASRIAHKANAFLAGRSTVPPLLTKGLREDGQ
ncbi:hypothetical protein LCGC14_1103870 [marine sediment metagenome]|uniref:Nucleotide exchange factor GrpE n=1 Tax=marine sediment metagenome TaxID=412755 RepID=A0A0F9MDA3_9ZZZZ